MVVATHLHGNKLFKEQLKDGAQMPQQPLPVAQLKDGKFEIYSTARSAENFFLALFLALANKIAEHDQVVFGLDTEADDKQQTRVIQICLPSSIFDRIIVLDLEPNEPAVGITLRRAIHWNSLFEE